jgi:hypothetical protein
LRVALPEPLSITPPTQTEVATNANSTMLSETSSTSIPSSAPSSSWFNVNDLRDSTKARVNSTLRRLNQQQADLLAEANSNVSANTINVSVTASGISSTNSPSIYSSSLFSSPLSSLNAENISPAMNDFFLDYRQQRQRMQRQNHSRSPVRPINNNNNGGSLSQRSSNTIAATNLFESPNATTINSGASVTVKKKFFFFLIY